MNKKLGIYLAFSFGLAWLICLWLWLSGKWLLPATLGLGLAACMFCPAAAVAAVKLLTKESWSDLGLRPRFKSGLKYYLLGWWGPLLCCLLGAALWYAFNPTAFDPTAARGQLGLLLVTFVLVPAVNVIPACGEELGWRGWLTPHLQQGRSTAKALLLSGLIWGLWHSPMIAMGHNYGMGYPGYPWTGILMFCLICVALGSGLAWLRLKSDSVWPAALAHGFFNGGAAIGLPFLAAGSDYNPFIGPMPVGLVGGAFVLLFGLLCFVSLSREKKSPLAANGGEQALPGPEEEVAPEQA